MEYTDHVAMAYEAYLEKLWDERCEEHDRMLYEAMEARQQLDEDLQVALDVANGAEAPPEVQAWALELLQAVGVGGRAVAVRVLEQMRWGTASRTDGRIMSSSWSTDRRFRMGRSVSHTSSRFGSWSGRGGEL
jgi:hypothetical protein